MRIRICWQGKTKNPNLRALTDEYFRRLQPFADVQIEETPNRSRKAAARSGGRNSSRKKDKSSFKVYLDGRGKQYSSKELARWMEKQALQGTREICFFLGGAEGFSESDLEKADLRLSLSRMTFTHDWARALLLEQIYRGFTILKGHPYPR